MSTAPFSPVVQAICAQFIPICRQLAGEQRYAIAVSGSLGKGTWDSRSDVDFRLFTDQPLVRSSQDPARWVAYRAAIEEWQAQGVNIDGIWPRTVGEIDAGIAGWLRGEIQPVNLVWTIWGYHLLTDVYNQFILEDPFGIIAGWKEQLRVYPPALKTAILQKYGASLRYWRADYHYANKVARGDLPFLAGMSAKLVHEILQILFALNEIYYPGDGYNLRFVDRFTIIPPNFAARVQTILYPPLPDPLTSQYRTLTALIDEVLALAKS